jgi:hypothetical protein
MGLKRAELLGTEHSDDYADTIRDYLRGRTLPAPPTLWELGTLVTKAGFAAWCHGPVMLYAGAALRDLIAMFYVLREQQHIAVGAFIAALPALLNNNATERVDAWQTDFWSDIRRFGFPAQGEPKGDAIRVEHAEIIEELRLERNARAAAQKLWTLTDEMGATFELAWSDRRLPHFLALNDRDAYVYAAIQVASATDLVSYTYRRRLVIEALLRWSQTE